MSSFLKRIRAGAASEPDNNRSTDPGSLSEGSTETPSRENMEIVLGSRVASQRDSLLPDAARQQQIEGAIYLLRGLPRDLTSDERVRLRVALPPQLDTHTRPPTLGLLPSNDQHDTDADTRSALRLPCVRPLAAEVTVCLVLLLIWISRKAAIVIGMLSGYDRRYHMSDAVIVQSAILFN